jgi:hypothetical protein
MRGIHFKCTGQCVSRWVIEHTSHDKVYGYRYYVQDDNWAHAPHPTQGVSHWGSRWPIVIILAEQAYCCQVWTFKESLVPYFVGTDNNWSHSNLCESCHHKWRCQDEDIVMRDGMSSTKLWHYCEHWICCFKLWEHGTLCNDLEPVKLCPSI